MREVELYAGLEPIGWDVGVSQPVEPQERGRPRPAPDVEDKLDAFFDSYEAGRA